MFKYFPRTDAALKQLAERELIFKDRWRDPLSAWHVVRSGIPDRDRDPVRAKHASEAFRALLPRLSRDLVKKVQQLSETDAYPVCWTTSLCKSGQNLIHWTRQAQFFEGFCLDLDESKTPYRVKPVNYERLPAYFDRFEHCALSHEIRTGGRHAPNPEQTEGWIAECRLALESIEQDLLTTMPEQFSDEEEVRLFFSGRPARGAAATYPPAAIRRVIFGERIGPEWRYQVLGVLKIVGARCESWTAKRSASTFSVVLQRD